MTLRPSANRFCRDAVKVPCHEFFRWVDAEESPLRLCPSSLPALVLSCSSDPVSSRPPSLSTSSPSKMAAPTPAGQKKRASLSSLPAERTRVRSGPSDERWQTDGRVFGEHWIGGEDRSNDAYDSSRTEEADLSPVGLRSACCSELAALPCTSSPLHDEPSLTTSLRLNPSPSLLPLVCQSMSTSPPVRSRV